MREKRVELNELIRGWKAERWCFMDLCREVPWGTMEECGRDEIWDDGLHFTERGYGVMGESTGKFILGSLEERDWSGRGKGDDENAGVAD